MSTPEFSDTPGTAMDVARHLGALTLELGKLVKALGDEEKICGQLHKAFREAYAVKWAETSGIAESRKQETILATLEEWAAHDASLTEIRKIKSEIDWMKDRISVGQSYGATVRAEIALAGSPFQRHA